MSEWQKIETAPKDGTPIRIRDRDGYEQEAWWDKDAAFDGWSIAPRQVVWSAVVTHWKPLEEE